MNWMRNLSTGNKLTLSFGLMAALILLAGFVGVRGMAGMRENLALLYERDALGVSHIKEANVHAIATQSSVRAALLDGQADKWQAEVKKREARFYQELGEYRKTLALEQDLAKAKEAETLFQELREVQDTILGLVQSGASTQAQGMWANLDPLLEALNTTLEDLSERKVAAMKKTAEDTWASYTASRNVVVGAVLAALLAAAVLAILITRTIAHPLGQAVRVLQSVAEGNFTRRLEAAGDDEVGRMASALNQALEAVSQARLEVSAAADETTAASRQMSGAAEAMSTGA